MGFKRCYHLICLMLIIVAEFSSAQLSTNFYARSCPTALFTIERAVHEAVSKEARMGASLLRLLFHDCFVNGCDASILLDDTAGFTGEKTARPNINSVRGFEVIDSLKSQLENICPGTVSCADILAVAARASVVALGGPSWIVELGRRDSTTASLSAANTDIPSPSSNLSALITSFKNKGFTPKEMVALSGAHTIGQARCVNFRSRIYNESGVDDTFAASLRSKCPSAIGDENLSPLDAASPAAFDNAYFRNVLNHKGLLHSDQQLFDGGSTEDDVRMYGWNAGAFMWDFATVMEKMSRLGVITGTAGEIRKNCRKLN